jgi:toxin ParE1/3/4
MLDLIWQPNARLQARYLIDYIAERNTSAAQCIKDLIDDRIALARAVPGVGRPGRVTGTRELIVHPNYIVIYMHNDTTLTVLRVLHAHQQYP